MNEQLHLSRPQTPNEPNVATLAPTILPRQSCQVGKMRGKAYLSLAYLCPFPTLNQCSISHYLFQMKRNRVVFH